MKMFKSRVTTSYSEGFIKNVALLHESECRVADAVTWYAFLAMKKKASYRIRNWSEYNASLKQRGRLTIWVSPEAVANWTTDELTGEPGASPTYTDLAIETMATVQAIYGLAGRQTQGFLQSLFELMKLDLTAPDHSTLSRRRRQLTITLPVKDWSKPRHLVVDSTGVKVYGEGEWKVRQHGVGKRRTWRKLHFCIDEATLEIVSVVASTSPADAFNEFFKARCHTRSASITSSSVSFLNGRPSKPPAISTFPNPLSSSNRRISAGYKYASSSRCRNVRFRSPSTPYCSYL